MRDYEYAKLPMEGTLELPAVIRTDGSDIKSSEDDVVGSMVFQRNLRAVNGFQERGHLGTGYSRL